MQSWGILLLLAISWVSVSSFTTSAQQEVQVAWERRITNFNFAAFLPDNVGNLALVGTREGFVTALLADTNGLLISARASCSRAPVGGVIVTSDSGGRIFAAAAEQFTNQLESNRNLVHCVRFEPLLNDATNFEDVFIGRFNIVMRGLLPNETGGVFAGIESWSVNETYVSVLSFEAEQSQYLAGVFHGSSYPGVRGGGIHSSGTNGFYMVGEALDAQVSRHSSSGELIWRRNFGSYYRGGLRAAAVDNSSDLIFIAGYRTSFGGPYAADIVKVSPQGEILWRVQRPGPCCGYWAPPYGIATAPNGAFVIWGDGALVKFNASGQELWTNTNSAPARFTSNGDILQWQQSENAVVITKLNSDGSVRWRKSHADAGAAAFVLGANDELYVAVLFRNHETAVLKYVEDEPVVTVYHDTIEAAQRTIVLSSSRQSQIQLSKPLACPVERSSYVGRPITATTRCKRNGI